MAMATLAFDTHKAVKTLTEAGAAEPLAEAMVATIGVAMGENIATKGDLQNLNQEIKAEIADLRVEIADLRSETSAFKAEMKAEMAAFKADMQAEMAAFKTDMQSEMAALRADMQTEMAALRADMRAGDQRMINRLGAMIAAGVGVLFVLGQVF